MSAGTGFQQNGLGRGNAHRAPDLSARVIPRPPAARTATHPWGTTHFIEHLSSEYPFVAQSPIHGPANRPESYDSESCTWRRRRRGFMAAFASFFIACASLFKALASPFKRSTPEPARPVELKEIVVHVQPGRQPARPVELKEIFVCVQPGRPAKVLNLNKPLPPINKPLPPSARPSPVSPDLPRVRSIERRDYLSSIESPATVDLPTVRPVDRRASLFSISSTASVDLPRVRPVERRASLFSTDFPPASVHPPRARPVERRASTSFAARWEALGLPPFREIFDLSSDFEDEARTPSPDSPSPQNLPAAHFVPRRASLFSSSDSSEALVSPTAVDHPTVQFVPRRASLFSDSGPSEADNLPVSDASQGPPRTFEPSDEEENVGAPLRRNSVHLWYRWSQITDDGEQQPVPAPQEEPVPLFSLAMSDDSTIPSSLFRGFSGGLYIEESPPVSARGF